MTTDEEIEKLSAEIHKCYCRAYERRFGKPYWTEGNYELLKEETKDYDREMARFMLKALDKKDSAIQALREEVGRLKSDGPGTPIGRLTFIHEIAEKECGHCMFSSRPPELAIQETLQSLRAENTRLLTVEQDLLKHDCGILMEENKSLRSTIEQLGEVIYEAYKCMPTMNDFQVISKKQLSEALANSIVKEILEEK